MSLADLWFVVVAVFWTGFFVLEGFDFGVGALHSVVGRSESERRTAISTVGPFWDGNEVWLVVGGAAIFAAFPGWYATWLSAAYLAVVLVLLALIVRGLSFEWRGKGLSDRWRWSWSLCLTLGSVVAPTVLGIALGDLVAGLPVDKDEEFTGSFWDLFTGFGVWTGVTLLVLCLLHGAVFLTLRIAGGLSERARAFAGRIGLAALAVVAVYVVWLSLIADAGVATYVVCAVSVVALAATLVALRRGRDGLAFTASAVAMATTVASLFTSLYPEVLVSTTSASYSLTVDGTASGDYALTVMTVVAAVFFPVVLVYQGYTYVVFRRRLGGAPTEPVGSV
ncbi:cytochrome d ubiquinol oxidase subunit II [Mumia sp. DW29H23]|uniref:cytochrome d ubiquinol oxidase subunit II n=1 Tax=Mumia sp. DW29H23 TaxID=3421241 RepID=UPI003D691722